jgi:hypothetical protein
MLKLSRQAAIARLRTHLLQFCDDDHSICQVAAERGIFCHGFARLDSPTLRKDYDWLAEKAHRPLTRKELESKANQWELARQVLHEVSIACDAEQIDRDQCKGWDSFSDAELARHCLELLGEEVEIVG